MDDLTTDEHIERLYSRISDLTEKIERMITAFLGNDQYGSRGWKHRIAENEQQIERAKQERQEMKDMVNKLVWWTAGAAAVATAIVNIAISIWVSG